MSPNSNIFVQVWIKHHTLKIMMFYYCTDFPQNSQSTLILNINRSTWQSTFRIFRQYRFCSKAFQNEKSTGLSSQVQNYSLRNFLIR